MKKQLYIFLGFLIGSITVFGVTAYAVTPTPIQYAPQISPLRDSAFWLGTTSPSTLAWWGIVTDEICLTGDVCRTTWPAGGSGGSGNLQADFPLVRSYGNATTTEIVFDGGFTSRASSTVSALLTVQSASSTSFSVSDGAVVNGRLILPAGAMFGFGTATPGSAASFRGNLVVGGGAVEANVLRTGVLIATSSVDLPANSITDAMVANDITLDSLLQVASKDIELLTTTVLAGNVYFSDGTNPTSDNTLSFSTLDDRLTTISASTTSFSAADRIWVAGAGTSTFVGGATFGGLNTTNGLIVQNGAVRTPLLNCDTIDSDGNGQLTCGSDATGAGGFTGGGGVNQLTYWDGKTSLNATSTPTAANFFATSTSVASSFPIASSTSFSVADGLNVGGRITIPSTTATSSFGGPITITGNEGTNALKITAAKNYGLSNSVGGMVNLTNTSNSSSALVVYSNFGAGASSRLVSFRCDNSLFDTQCLHVESDGVESSVNVLGAPAGKGILKIGSSGVGDPDASGLSIDTSLVGFVGQGIFLKGNSTGKLLNIRASDNRELFTLNAVGMLGLGSSTPGAGLAIHNASTTLGGPVTVFGPVKGPYFQATSTTITNEFPIASTTSFSVADRLWVAGAGTSTFAGSVDAGSVLKVAALHVTGATHFAGASIPNAALENSSLTVTAGNGLTDGGAISLGGSATINLGVDSSLSVAADSVGINLGNSNTWTVAQIFNGGLGVGTATPGTLLQVKGGSVFGTSTHYGLVSSFLTATSTFSLYTGGGANPRFFIDASGNIGIATTSISSALSVNGGVLLSGGVVNILSTTTLKGAQFSIGVASTTAAPPALYVIDWSPGNTRRMIIQQATTIIVNATSSNPRDGGHYIAQVCQNHIGGFAISINSDVVRNATTAAGSDLSWVSTKPNTCTRLGFFYDDLYKIYTVVATSTGIPYQ